MKFLIDPEDAHKLKNVKLILDVEDRRITIIAMQQRRDGTYEVFHQDQFSAPE